MTSLAHGRGSASMPNVTFFITAEEMPLDGALADLTSRCARLCTEVLQAAPENVHIFYVAVRQGRGHPLFAEVRCRLAPFRAPALMQTFMESLDEAIRCTTGLVGRIRCFGYAVSSIHARN